MAIRTRFPIFAKVLLVFGLNLLLLATAFVFFVRSQMTEEMDSLLGRQVAGRFGATAESMHDRVEKDETLDWETVLTERSKDGAISYFLFQPSGNQLAGPPIELPDAVADRLSLRGATNRRNGAGPRPGGPPLKVRPGGAPRIEDLPPEAVNFHVKSDDPPAYWFCSRFSVHSDEFGRRIPAILLARTNSLFGAGILTDLRSWTLFAGAMLLLSIAIWLPLIRDLTRSVRNVTKATERVAAGDFDIMLDEQRRDELGRLGSAINRMSRRLGGFVSGQKRFLGDTAHELCAPLARMQMATGILEQRATLEQREYVAGVREELQHMSDLVNELLSFSKAGFDQKIIELQPVDLSPLVENVVRRESISGCSIQTEIADGIAVIAEPDLLSRAIGNVVRNAIRYGGAADCQIEITTVASNQTVALTIADNGHGVPPEDLPKLFDPFYRVDAARTRETGGTGLGLAIVKTCVESCEGSVYAVNQDEGGLAVTITLRRAPSAEEE